MRKTVQDKAQLKSSNRFFKEPFGINNISEEADFCINHCAHPKKSCKGSCPEWREWAKQHLQSTNKSEGGSL